MPNRIIREALLTSPRISKLKFDNRWLYLGLLLSADDYGRIEYTSDKLLNAKIFPRDDVRDSDISRWIAECEKAGLLLVYEAKSSRFIQLHDFKQQTRSESKCPAPDEALLRKRIADATQAHSEDIANDHLGVFVFGGVAEGVSSPAENIMPEVKNRISKIFKRRENTKWDDKEIKKLKEIIKREDCLAELAELEIFYKSDYEYKRHELETFLNNWTGELDKSRKYSTSDIKPSDSSDPGYDEYYAKLNSDKDKSI